MTNPWMVRGVNAVLLGTVKKARGMADKSMMRIIGTREKAA